MRFFTVLVLVVGSGALAGLALRNGSVVMGSAAVLLALIALIIFVRGGSKRRAVREASATSAALLAAATATSSTPPAPETTAPIASDVSRGVALAETSKAAELVVDSAPEGAAAETPEPSESEEMPPDEGSGVMIETVEPVTEESGVQTAPEVQDAEPEDVEAAQAGDETDTGGFPSVRTPFSVQPAVVLMSLYDAIAKRFETLSAHLWLEDAPTGTLRLVAAFGPRVPGSDPVPLSDPVLGLCASTRSAVFQPLDSDGARDAREGSWRYAVPIGTPEVRGVAAVDIVLADPAQAALVLNEVSSILRGSLTAALAVHVARAEMDTAVLLLQAAQELTSGIAGDDVLTAALERAMQVAGASTGSVMTPSGAEGQLRIVASRGLSSDVVATTSVVGGEGIAGTVYSTSAPLLVEDLPGRSGLRRHGVMSSVSVPIADAQGSFGVINVGARAFPARLTDAYVRALGILGAQTAVAMRNARAAEQSWDLYLENLQALATALESDDPYRSGASKRTTVLSVALAKELGVEDEDIVSLRIAAILHDVGMGLATGSVGSIDRPLSTVDRGLVRAHPKVASDVLQRVPSLERLAPMVRHHHERFDGNGYDTGLAGESIPLGSRILAVADAFVAMTSPRPYRSGLSLEEALEELNSGSGGQFDPTVVDAFIAMLAEHPELALLD